MSPARSGGSSDRSGRAGRAGRQSGGRSGGSPGGRSGGYRSGGAARSGGYRTGGVGRSAPASGRRTNQGLGGEQIEGRRAVEELLATRLRPVRDVWVAEGNEASPVLEHIVELATARRVSIHWVARSRLDGEARTDAHQGVLAHAEALPEAVIEQLAAGSGERMPFLILLEGVTDPHNLGAVMRSAECAGATGVVIPRHSSARITPTVAKAAAGAIEHLPIATVPGIAGALTTLARAGVWTVGLDGGAPASIFDLDVADRPVALVLGAEGSGLSRLSRARCDLLVSIPQAGSVASLNVSAAAAVACFEVARARATRSR